MMIKINQTDFGTLAICAIRYCHGRRTYMPELVQDILKVHLQELSDIDLHVMIRDCDNMNEYDYGDPVIDKPKWIEWKKALEDEQNKRMEGGE